MTSAPTDFYPRPPRGGRRLYRHSQADVVNFYPRPPQGGRPLQFPLVRTDDVISIHALREEGDRQPLRGGTPPQRFLSTPSARRATLAVLVESVKPLAEFLSTPSARRATTQALARDQRRFDISIHALREEGDYSLTGTALSASDFYPRPPRGGRRISYRRDAATMRISIHALREEGDRLNRNSENRFAEFLSTPSARRATRASSTATSTCSYFYPRPPRGGRLYLRKPLEGY